MANHRAEGRAHVRPLAATGKGAHRNSQTVSTSVVKVGMLGALATATIAAPLASAAADQGVTLPTEAQAAAAKPAAAPATSEIPVQSVSAQSASAQYGSASAGGALTVSSKGDSSAQDDASNEADEASGEEASTSAGWAQPTKAAPRTSSFGYRVHPTLGYRKMHDGLDYGASCGSPAYAAKGGTVIEARYHSVSGNRVKIDHGNGVITSYYHLSSYSVSTGQKIAKGEKVGSVGSTGRSTGCHLHFGVEKGEGNYVNPMSLWQ